MSLVEQRLPAFKSASVGIAEALCCRKVSEFEGFEVLDALVDSGSEGAAHRAGGQQSKPPGELMSAWAQ